MANYKRIFDKNTNYTTKEIAFVYCVNNPGQYKSERSCLAAISPAVRFLDLSPSNGQSNFRVFSGKDSIKICEYLEDRKRVNCPKTSEPIISGQISIDEKEKDKDAANPKIRGELAIKFWEAYEVFGAESQVDLIRILLEKALSWKQETSTEIESMLGNPYTATQVTVEELRNIVGEFQEWLLWHFPHRGRTENGRSEL